MTARPDVPDTPDRTDAIARLFENREPCEHEEGVRIRDGVIIECYPCAAADLLATDDPAAVAALAATLAERHPDALLTALHKAGALRAKYAVREVSGDIWLDAHGIGPEAKPGGLEHDERADAEAICAGPPDEAVVSRLVTVWTEVSP